jgi:glucan phosphoethanolaminetransferase (alkaline phosphatase superfamily)
MNKKTIKISLPVLLLLIFFILLAGIFFSNFVLKKVGNFSFHKIISGTAVNPVTIEKKAPDQKITNDVTSDPIPSKNKKVVLVSIDNVRPDHLSAYGYGRDTSPNINRISQESVIFKNAYTSSPSTIPSHISLLSGLPSKDFKIFNNMYSEEINNTSLVTLFKDKGYETAAFISVDLLNHNFFKQGFNIFDFEPEKSKEQITLSLDEFPWIAERSNENTNKKAMDWLEQNYNKDFFLFVHYYDAAPPFNNNCGRDFSHGLKQPSNKIFSKGIVLPLTKASDSDIEFLKAKYDEGIFCDDKSVGELIEKMKSLDIYKDATIIIISDHGEFFDHSMLFHEYTLYEESIKVAMIIKSPLLKSAIRENETPVMLTDIFPTLSETFQLSKENKTTDSFNLFKDTYPRDLFFITPNLAGLGFISSLPMLHAPENFFDSSEIESNKTPFFFKGAISNQKKMIMAGDDVDQIYDLSKDNGEKINLKDDESYGQFREEEKNKIENFFSEISSDYLPVSVINKPAN